MIPLSHVPPEPEELRLVLSRLRSAHVRYLEREGNFLTPATIWVEEEDFDTAVAVLKQCFSEYPHLKSRRRSRVLPRGARPWQIWRYGATPAILALLVIVGTFAVYPLLMVFAVLR